MKNLKKVLACLLVAAMTLTCFVGALTVSADGTGTIEAGNVEVADDATSVVVPVTINADAALNAAKITVAASQGWVVDAITVADGAAYIDEADVNGGTFLIQANDNVAGFATATVNVAMTSKVACEADVVITLDEVHAATWGEEVVNLAITNGKITVAEPAPVGPVVDTALKFQTVSLGYGPNSLQLAFRVRNTVLALYADMDIVIIPQKYDSSLNLVAEPQEIVVKQSELVNSGSTMKQYYYYDMQLYELGLDINYMLRAYDEDGNLVAVSETFTTSPATYLKTLYASSSSNEKLLTLITDTLVVGDESFKSMAASYPESDLAKATSVIEGFDTSKATASVDSYNTVNDFVGYNAAYGNASSTATYKVRTSVAIGKAPSITYRLQDSKKALDIDKVSFNISYTKVSADGTQTPINETYNTANAGIARSGNFIECKFDLIGLGNGDKDILLTATYDGEKVFELTYSVESYLGANMTNASIGKLATALCKLGISFRAYSAK